MPAFLVPMQVSSEISSRSTSWRISGSFLFAIRPQPAVQQTVPSAGSGEFCSGRHAGAAYFALASRIRFSEWCPGKDKKLTKIHVGRLENTNISI